MKEKIKKALGLLAIVGGLAMPAVVHRIVDGKPKVAHLRESYRIKHLFEYEDKIMVTDWLHPFGMKYIDDGKDGILDQVFFDGASRVFIRVRAKPDSLRFQSAQRDYENLLVEYTKQ